MNITRRGATVTVIGAFLFMWGTGALATKVTGVSDLPPASSTVEGEATREVEPEAVPPPAIQAPPRATPTPSRASRTRPTSRVRLAPKTGRVLSCTCYVATGNRTASGEWPRPGTAASNLYSFGTLLHVEGVGLVRVNDRVGHSSDLDLFYTSRSDCLRFGRRALHVEVISRG